MRSFLLVTAMLLACGALAGAEKAGYDSRGRIVSLLSAAGEIEAASNYVAVLPDGRRVELDRQVGGGPRTQGQLKSWAGSYAAAEGSRIRLEWKTEDTDGGLRYTTTVTPESGEYRSVEFVLDLPRDVFVNGRFAPAGGAAVPLTPFKPAGPALFAGRAQTLRFESASGAIWVTLALDAARQVAVHDRWDLLGTAQIMPGMPLDEGGQSGTMYYGKTRRSYQVRIPLFNGPVQPGTKGVLDATFTLVNKTVAQPARLAVDASKVRFQFDGFGANFCWDNGRVDTHPIQEYLIKALKLAWARTEMKIQAWDRQRDNPDRAVRYDLETMRTLQKMGVPYVVSVWRLPERFNADPATEPPGARGRAVNPDKWDELTDLLAQYLLYARKEYGVEPDMFSFNEGNLGVNVRLTPAEHTAQIKRMGAAFERLGLKTKMVLGDAVPARDSHIFALDAAADPEARKYIAAVAYHSWGGASPQQYAAWGDLAEWLQVPLLVTELGVDSQAFATNAWDTWQYGLREAQFTQEMLLYSRPQGTQFWQYTDDYALVHASPGGEIQPTARFWLMKHFTDLTPIKSEGLAASSDQPDVLLTAFRKAGAYTLHIVNRGGDRDATLSGAPEGEWQVTESTEAAQFSQNARVRASGGTLRLRLPARALVTLTLQNGRTGN